MENKQNIPELRFPEFKGEWESKKLGDISNFISKGTTPSNFSNQGVKFVKIESLNGIHIDKEKCLFIDKKTHINVLKRSILEDGDILFAIAGATVGKIGFVTNDILPANTNQALAIIRLEDKNQNDFILFVLDSLTMKRYIKMSISVGAQPNLNLQQINNFEYFSPTLPEQTKIANFLTYVDGKLQNLKKKKNLLEQYKKGVMQKIFSLDLRFKDNNGKEFPEWEENTLSDLAKIMYGKDQKQVATENGKYPILGTGGLMGSTDQFLYDKPSVLIGRKGTIDKPVYMDTPFWTVDTLFYTEVYANTFPQWLYYKFQTINWYLYNEASGVPSLSSSTIYKIKIELPSYPEQTKIADFLTGIDKKIEHCQKQIEQVKKWKKGLLQKMFV